MRESAPGAGARVRGTGAPRNTTWEGFAAWVGFAYYYTARRPPKPRHHGSHGARIRLGGGGATCLSPLTIAPGPRGDALRPRSIGDLEVTKGKDWNFYGFTGSGAKFRATTDAFNHLKEMRKVILAAIMECAIFLGRVCSTRPHQQGFILPLTTTDHPFPIHPNATIFLEMRDRFHF